MNLFPLLLVDAHKLPSESYTHKACVMKPYIVSNRSVIVGKLLYMQ